LGISTATASSASTQSGAKCAENAQFEKACTLVDFVAARGLVAATRPLQTTQRALTLYDLAIGEQRMSFPLRKDAVPIAMGFHPVHCTFGALALRGCEHRLLLYSNVSSGVLPSGML
jgi:hypothetical protein